MAKKNNTDLVGVGKAPPVAKGFKRVEATDAPFWAPMDAEAEHPNPIVGIVQEIRELPARGKFPAQRVIDLATEEGPFTVPQRGNLKRLVKSAGLGVGQQIRVTWLGKAAADEKMPLGQNVFDLQVAE